MATPDRTRAGDPRLDDEPLTALFLQRQPYRRRRLIDAARVLPIFGTFLMLVPAVLLPKGVMGTTSAMMLFLVSAWLALIVAAALIVRYLTRREGPLSRSSGRPEDD